MRLFSPWALTFLSLIPLVMLMYILKQKFEERIVPSTYLWEQALKDIEVNTPWQRLKKNLLLYLQLLIVLFLTFALSNPYLSLGTGSYENIIVVIDNSGSMNALYKNSTRLEAAKQKAVNMVKSSASGANFTVVSSGRKTEILINASKNKADTINKINEIKTSNSTGNMDDAVALSKALSKQYESCKVMIYSDNKVGIDDIKGEVEVIASKLENASIDYISHSIEEDSLKALIRVTNRSDVDISREISLYGEEKLIHIQNVDFKPGESKSIYFDGIPGDVSYIYGELTEEDGLLEDNSAFDIIKAVKPKKVLMVSNKNIFIEKMLTIISGLEVYKSVENEKIDDKYDLYIYDGSLPDILPKSGSLLVINPPLENKHFVVGEVIQGGALKAVTHSLTKYIGGLNASVSKFKTIEMPYWAEEVMTVDGKTAVMVGENKGQRQSIIAFDLHDSDFVLSSEYPMLFSSLLSYLIGIGSNEKTVVKSGEQVNLDISSDVTAAAVMKPSGQREEITLRYPIGAFENTDELGIYKVLEKAGETETSYLFCANFPSETESDISGESFIMKSDADGASKTSGGMNISIYLLLLGLLVMAFEWVVYTGGY